MGGQFENRTGRITVFHYPKCSTCKKARKWLDTHGIEHDAIDIVTTPPSRKALEALYKRSGLPLRKFFNTSGQSYRQGNFSERLKSMSESEALDALAADGKLIKRPLLAAPDAVLVGFKEPDYAAALT